MEILTSGVLKNLPEVFIASTVLILIALQFWKWSGGNKGADSGNGNGNGNVRDRLARLEGQNEAFQARVLAELAEIAADNREARRTMLTREHIGEIIHAYQHAEQWRQNQNPPHPNPPANSGQG